MASVERTLSLSNSGSADAGRRSAMRAMLRVAALPLGLLVARPARAASPLRMLVSDDSESTQQIVAALLRHHPAASVTHDVNALPVREGAAVYLAAGPAALQSALGAMLPGPLLSLFVSSTAYARAVRLAVPPSKHALSAIYAEASPLNQMRLIRLLYARRVTVGVLLSASTADLEPELAGAARTAGLDLVVHRVDAGDNPVRALAALASAQVLLTLPDPDIYSIQNLRPLLEATYRRRQGAIGFSTALVRAGTLAAAYASIDDVIAQVGTMADALGEGRATPPQHPAFWRVMVNDSVARSLNLIVDAATLALGNSPS